MALKFGRFGQGRMALVSTVLRWQSVECARVRISASGNVMQVATLKATYGEKYPYAKPFPYEKKVFNLFASMFDRTIPRLNENSKIIVVEGNVAVGKTEFAKRLAKSFDLKYFPPTPEISCFLEKVYNYDMRKLDELLPRSAQSYDLARFYAEEHPERGEVGKLQLQWYMEKFNDYLAALKHLLSTGQGVVLVRSVYSDLVFVEACRRLNWLTPSFVKYYYELRDNSICELLKPHLTMFLDAPIEVLRQRINKRNDPKEVGSKILSDNYLKTIQSVYQEKFLPQMRVYGEVVEVDWTEVADDDDMEAMVEELQLAKLETDDKDGKKFEDWNRNDEDEYTRIRFFLENNSHESVFTKELPFECPEIMATPDDMPAVNRLVLEHPIYRFQHGWAPSLGYRTAFKF